MSQAVPIKCMNARVAETPLNVGIVIARIVCKGENMRLPSMKTLERVAGERAKEVRELLEQKRKTVDYQSVREWEKLCWNRPRYSERLMCALNEILGGYGVVSTFAGPLGGSYGAGRGYANATGNAVQSITSAEYKGDECEELNMKEETGAGYPVASEIRLGGLLRLFLRHNHLIGAKVKGCAQKITHLGLQFPRTSIYP